MVNTSGTRDSKLSIRKNDQVQVIAGREKGKTGKVLKVFPRSFRITVEKVNLMKRHVKPSTQHPQGGMILKETALHYSNVLLLCPKCNRGVRHKHQWVETSKKQKKGTNQVKVRACKRCNEVLEKV